MTVYLVLDGHAVTWRLRSASLQQAPADEQEVVTTGEGVHAPTAAMSLVSDPQPPGGWPDVTTIGDQTVVLESTAT